MNCNAPLIGRFCHVCGQENVEPRESAWGLVSHFFYDITHFDGKFFSTLKWLIGKPGFLSKEYIKGRRASYLNPVKMYVFTSAIFFILFFSFFINIKEMIKDEPHINNKVDSETAKKYGYDKYALRAAKTKEDSAEIIAGLAEVHKFTDTLKTLANNKDTGNREKKGGIRFRFDTTEYTSVAQYDSLQKLLPASEQHNWLQKRIMHKRIELQPEFRKDSRALFRKWADKFVHSFTQILFISLPLIALVLQLLYVRRRKEFYYVSHGIFLIHIYIYSFIILLIYFSIDKLGNSMGWEWMGWIKFTLFLYAIWYVYKAMLNFYGQGWFKTLVKFCLLNLFTLIIINLLFVVFILFSAWNL